MRTRGRGRRIRVSLRVPRRKRRRRPCCTANYGSVSTQTCTRDYTRVYVRVHVRACAPASLDKPPRRCHPVTHQRIFIKPFDTLTPSPLPSQPPPLSPTLSLASLSTSTCQLSLSSATAQPRALHRPTHASSPNPPSSPLLSSLSHTPLATDQPCRLQCDYRLLAPAARTCQSLSLAYQRALLEARMCQSLSLAHQRALLGICR